MNLYEYVYNNPANWVDPLGLVPWWEEVWIYTKTTFRHLPGAYWGTAMSGEQFSALLGYSDGITGALNPFGEGTRFGAYGRYREAYGSGKTVGGAGGFTMNAVLLVSGVRGTVSAVNSIRAAGGLFQVGQMVTSTGQVVNVVMVNGQAVVATMQGLLNAGLSAAAAKNLLNGIEGSGGSKPEKCPEKHPGSKGKPDHQEKVQELGKKAEKELKPGETVLQEKKIQKHPSSKRRPDQQIVDKTGKTRKAFEAERHPNRKRNRLREQEYDRLGIEHETHKLD